MNSLKITIQLLLLSNLTIIAQNLTIPLWEGTPPNFKVTDEEEIHQFEDGITKISYVQSPDIAVYLPSPRMAAGKAIIICPGGGYWILAYDLEGTDIAKYFNSKGIAAIILKYRLPVSKSNIEPHKTPLLDAQRAMRIVRKNAVKWNINPQQIGIMGFSAGGHLASTLSTHFDLGNKNSNDSIEQQSCRPDFSILVYPVISFLSEFGHSGSKSALFGEENPPDDLVRYYSNELMVREDTPPAILIHASDDTGVAVANSIAYYQALQKFGIPSELHIYPYGGHGFGLALNREPLSAWPDECFKFINQLFNQD